MLPLIAQDERFLVKGDGKYASTVIGDDVLGGN
jgi:hypothetical protein